MSNDNNKEINYFRRFCLLMLAVAGALFVLNFLIPKDTEFSAIDMFADVRKDQDDDDDDSSKEESLNQEATRGNTLPQKEDKPKAEPSKQELRLKLISKISKQQGFHPSEFTAIEDFSKNANALENFYEKLRGINELDRPLRIAFLGDSFIESDIFTAPLRERLQNKFGGLGVGFMGLWAEALGYRKSIIQRVKDWSDKSVLVSGNGAQILSGHKFVARDGAWVSYQMPDGREGFEEATIYYTARRDATISIKIAGETTARTLRSTGGALRSLSLYSGQAQKHIRLSVLEGADGLQVFGLALEGHKGISLDNFALRGASGIQLGGINDALSRSFASLRPYDLIVLEYGLNVVSKTRKEYSGYRKQMATVINKIKKYYPETDILLLGVSDRDQKNSDRLHKNTLALLKQQRRVAQEKGLAFWSTLDAIQQMGGVKYLVRKGLAAKDYTHLSHKGGEKVSQKLYDALMIEKDYYDK